LLLLKETRAPELVTVEIPDLGEDEAFGNIRCPHCGWRPSADSSWCCYNDATTPEPAFEWCGTVWNTFTTGGRCPGCSHQWEWTSCLRCEQWSRHQDWYEESKGHP
jgi:DNA-directed RNA polymerase subunit RPC12/RpoP